MSNSLLYRQCGLCENTYDFRLNGGHCQVNAGVGKDWLTVYLIKTESAYQSKGEATKLLKELKERCENTNRKMLLFCPMNEAVEHLCKKLDIEIIDGVENGELLKEER